MINSKIITIDKNKIKSENIDRFVEMTKYHYHGWNLNPGSCEYILYWYLSEYFENTTILDIGTGGGGSSKAFGLNQKNNIISFDILKRLEIPKAPKVEYRVGNFMEDKTIDYNNVSIIMIDVDPHDGIQEPPMLEFLTKINWSGLLIFDDIKCDRFSNLEKYWNELTYEKYDLTDVGHDSGTGLINFGNKHKIVIKELV